MYTACHLVIIYFQLYGFFNAELLSGFGHTQQS